MFLALTERLSVDIEQQSKIVRDSYISSLIAQQQQCLV